MRILTTKNIGIMEIFRFEDLPIILGSIEARLENIEKILEKVSSGKTEFENDLVTIEEASSFLKLSVATVYSKVCRNELPFNKNGKRLYFFKSELMEWIKAGRVKTVDEIRQDVNQRFGK